MFSNHLVYSFSSLYSVWRRWSFAPTPVLKIGKQKPALAAEATNEHEQALTKVISLPLFGVSRDLLEGRSPPSLLPSLKAIDETDPYLHDLRGELLWSFAAVLYLL